MARIFVLYHDDILYHNNQTLHLNMLTELLVMGAILASCGLLTWSAMKKYQPKIESRLEEIESRGAELEVTERRYK